MNRRDFIKTLSGGALLTGAAMVGCSDQQPRTGDSESAAHGDIPTDQMTYRTAKRGERVSLLGYGCMRWPTVTGKSAREDANDIDQEQVNRLIDYALEHGVNYFDTSPAYCKGFSERATGIALHRHPRDSYFVATKLSNFAPETWSHQESVNMYHRSMEYLQVDYIDFYLLHSLGNGADPLKTFHDRYVDNGMLDFLLKEREAGRIRNLGFSYHGDLDFFEYLLSLDDKYHWDFVQPQHNYVDYRHAKDVNRRNSNSLNLLEALTQHNIPAIIMEPLLGGRLAELNDYSTRLLKQREPEHSIASWAMRFSANDPIVLTTLSGMTYMEHLQDNLRSFTPFQPLTNDELELLEKVAVNYVSFPIVPCTACQYCMPCPYGLDIPTIFGHYNKSLNRGDIITDQADPNYLSAKRHFLIDYNRRVPRERQADHCINCEQCKPHCPQHIDIPRQLNRIDLIVERLKRM